MASLHDLVLYVCKHYPHKSDLSKARLTKMLYLADWRSAITTQRQMTDLTWTFNHYGPYLDDIVDEARRSDDFDVTSTINAYGSPKVVIEAREDARDPHLTESERAILDHVIEETSGLYFNDFIKLVYSTYPIVTQPRYQALDLVQLATQYEDLQEKLRTETSANDS